MPRPTNFNSRLLSVFLAMGIGSIAIAIQTPGFAKPRPPRPVPTPPAPLNQGALNPRPRIFDEPPYNHLSGRPPAPDGMRDRRPDVLPREGDRPTPPGARQVAPPPPLPNAPGEQSIPVPSPKRP